MAHPKARIIDVRPADENNQVVSVTGGGGAYRRSPCGGCPWKVDQTGSFPAEAFGCSAKTAYDMAVHMFACHEAGVERPATCAGFLLHGAAHNLTARMKLSSGEIDPGQLDDGGHELHRDYRTMATANGLDPADPRLVHCRDLDLDLLQE